MHSWFYLPEVAGDPGELAAGDFAGDEATLDASTKIYVANGSMEGDPSGTYEWFEQNGYIGYAFLRGSSASRWMYVKVNAVTQQGTYCEFDVEFIDKQLSGADFTNGERVYFTLYLFAPPA